MLIIIPLAKVIYSILQNYIHKLYINQEGSNSSIGSEGSSSWDEDMGGRIIRSAPPWWHAILNGIFAVGWIAMMGILAPLCVHLQGTAGSGSSIALCISLACLSGVNL